MVFRKKTTRRTKKRSFRKRRVNKRSKKNFASKNVIKYMPGRQLPLPPRYVTKLECDNTGTFTSGGAFVSNGYFVKLNSINNPMNTAATNLPNPTLAIATLDPTGLKTLFNVNGYTEFRVFKSQIMFKMTTASLSDNIGVCIIPAFTGQTATYDIARSKPFAKEMNFNTLNNGKWIRNTIGVPKLVGVRAQAIKDDLSGNFIGDLAADPGQTLLWNIYLKDLNGGNLTVTTGWEIKIRYWVELFELANVILPE